MCNFLVFRVQRDSDGDSGQEDACEKHKDSKIFSIAMGIKQQPKVPSPKMPRVRTFSTRGNWLKAAAKVCLSNFLSKL